MVEHSPKILASKDKAAIQDLLIEESVYQGEESVCQGEESVCQGEESVCQGV